jgi:hypothetical protein
VLVTGPALYLSQQMDRFQERYNTDAEAAAAALRHHSTAAAQILQLYTPQQVRESLVPGDTPGDTQAPGASATAASTAGVLAAAQ